jgi:hypothetical protein
MSFSLTVASSRLIQSADGPSQARPRRWSAVAASTAWLPTADPRLSLRR